MDQVQHLMDQQLKEQITEQNTRLGAFEQEQKANGILLVKLDTKFDYMASGIKSLTEAMNDKLTKLEVRVVALEQTRDQVNPQKIATKVEDHDTFINDYRSTHKERNQTIAFVGSIFAFALSIGGLVVTLLK